MAANSKSTREIANLGKRVVNHFFTRDPAHSAVTRASRRAAHNSAYDKNIDDQVRPAIVPDDVIQPLSDKYWAPHPQTGVFGPAVENRPGAGGEREYYSSPANGSGESVLEEKAWFRPTSLEDLEKPLHH
ncbi:late embryogenesis abundant protein At5g17165 [Pistacia vera]|uniref:late embryogenesis abundant protein At5g17165 n=1 Tax=Pistacia vera TaxID=55513 RepID=UPI0012636BC2|nr:late embryogenesis abundant protein At5g17165 [Pistacia vera]